jgi:hypothetical protein
MALGRWRVTLSGRVFGAKCRDELDVRDPPHWPGEACDRIEDCLLVAVRPVGFGCGETQLIGLDEPSCLALFRHLATNLSRVPGESTVALALGDDEGVVVVGGEVNLGDPGSIGVELEFCDVAVVVGLCAAA